MSWLLDIAISIEMYRNGTCWPNYALSAWASVMKKYYEKQELDDNISTKALFK